MRTKTCQFNFRCTESELAALTRLAAQLGLDRSVLILRLLSDKAQELGYPFTEGPTAAE